MIRLFRRLQRYNRIFIAAFIMLFAMANWQAALACTLTARATPMVSCDMGNSCPHNHPDACIAAHTSALPSATSVGDIYPVWVALPVQVQLFQTIPATAPAAKYVDYSIIPSGPPIHLRFCSFLK